MFFVSAPSHIYVYILRFRPMDNILVSMHPCACAQFGTDCSALASRTFARGHDAKLRKRIVDAITTGVPLLRDGLPADPYQVAAEFSLTAHVNHFVQLHLAKLELAAQRQAELQTSSADRDLRRHQALALRTQREQERSETRLKALAARQHLLEQARLHTDHYLQGFTWDNDRDNV